MTISYYLTLVCSPHSSSSCLAGIGRITLIGDPVQMPADMISRIQSSTTMSKVLMLKHYRLKELCANCDRAQVAWAPQLDFLTGVINAAVLVNVPFTEAVALNNHCRSRQIKTVLARSLGTAGCVFCDFIDHTATRSIPFGADQLVNGAILSLVDFFSYC